MVEFEWWNGNRLEHFTGEQIFEDSIVGVKLYYDNRIGKLLYVDGDIYCPILGYDAICSFVKRCNTDTDIVNTILDRIRILNNKTTELMDES